MSLLKKVTDVLSVANSAVRKSEVMAEIRRVTKGAYTGNNGYAVPGSRSKAMKGITSTPNSPSYDIAPKLSGMRGLSRDQYMRAPLSVAILDRHQIAKIGPGLQFQSRPDYEFLGISPEQSADFAKALERDFDLWANSLCSDYDHSNYYGDNQALGYLNMLMSGDFFIVPTWAVPLEAGFPFNTSIKLIDADLVRDPINMSFTDDIIGGVEMGADKRPLGIHVWNTYEHDYVYGQGIGESTFVPFFSAEGRQQVFHVVHNKRIKQRRGVPFLAPMAEPIAQSTRLFDASLMYHVVSNFFTAFVRDMSGMGELLQEAVPPEKTVTGGGSYGPNDMSGPYAKYARDGSDLEMGIGNIVYLDDHKDVTIAEPRKTDRDFPSLWGAYANTVCAGASIPVGSVLMKHEESYTAARAAQNDDAKVIKVHRALINRKMNTPVLEAVATESVMRGRIEAPGFLDDYSRRRAYLRGAWIGIGMGSLDPFKEARANALNVANFNDTHEDIYVETRGERWDSAMERRATEQALLEELGLDDRPAPQELIGADAQEDDNGEDDDTGGNDIGGNEQ